VSAPPVPQDDVAAWFDATYRRRGLAYLRPARAYPIFVQLLGARRGERLLDVACGPGLLLDAAAARGVVASGVDLSTAAIELAQQRRPGIDARVLDREAALREMLRVAKPDARFCFLVRNASTLVWRLWRERLGRREVQGHQDAQTLVQWRALFARCGFRELRVLPDQWPQQRWRQLLPWRRPRQGRDEPVHTGLLPLRWCNELVFVLARADA
jgi:SAM-dependent methyltransferase